MRYLLVNADDYGIGPATSEAILDLAMRGRVTSAVLMVNSPYAVQSVSAWQKAGKPMELGWHPCLTMDAPILPAGKVPSLVGADGCLWSLAQFMRRWCLGRLQAAEIAAELQAQLDRFIELVGHAPTVVNSHQHTQIFRPVGDILIDILKKQRPLPYLRRIRESFAMLVKIPGARLKRSFLSFLGRRDARLQEGAGLPGNDRLAGITDPPYSADPEFFTRWLGKIKGAVIELACHPGHYDATLIGRDCTGNDGLLERRVHEYRLLCQSSYREAYTRAGFTLVSPAQFILHGRRGLAHAA
ncbi:MAG TPA: ChbG/HpnK family deacetylase [Gemmataceae bacterium]|jgi:hypothetical protein|nr:ChbG/HpnK family deacetylase [Gemmataceae bacterium]